MTINMLYNSEIEMHNTYIEELREILDIVCDELLGSNPDEITAE